MEDWIVSSLTFEEFLASKRQARRAAGQLHKQEGTTMIEGATYLFNKDQAKVAGPTNFGWEKITLVERRVKSTETFDKERVGEHKMTRNNYEWVVFTHSDQGYVTVDEDLFEDETGMGIYELANWRNLRDRFLMKNSPSAGVYSDTVFDKVEAAREKLAAASEAQ